MTKLAVRSLYVETSKSGLLMRLRIGKCVNELASVASNPPTGLVMCFNAAF